MIQENVSSKIFLTLHDFLFKYGEKVYESTAGIFLGLFLSFYVIKITWDIAHKSLFKKETSLEDFIKPVVVVSFLTAVLSTSYFAEAWIVKPFYDLSIHLATITASLTTELPPTANIADMLHLVDARLNQVVFIPAKIASDLVGWSVWLHIGILIIQALYTFVWFLFLALLVEALFRFMTFFAVSPLIIVSLFFPQTKQIGLAGFRSLLHGMLSLFMAGVAMGMTIAVIASTQDLFIVDGKISADWVFSESYFSLILIALVSISFHLKAPKIAANLANIDDGPGAAATVAGIGTAAVMASKGAMMGAAGKTAGLGDRGLVAGAKGLHGLTSLKSGKDLYSRMTGKKS